MAKKGFSRRKPPAPVMFIEDNAAEANVDPGSTPNTALNLSLHTQSNSPLHLLRLLTEERERAVLVWLLNIGAEKYWNPVQPGIVDANEDRIVGRMEEMNLLLCRKQDILILREQPDPDYLDQLAEWGFALPRIRIPAGSDSHTPISELVLADGELLAELQLIAQTAAEAAFVPYAATYLEEEIAARSGLSLLVAPAAVNAAVNDKIRNREMAEELGLPVCEGKVCASIEEIREVYHELTGSPFFFEKVIIKEPHGASGKGLYIIESVDRLHALLLRLNRYARSHPEARWLVEGWYRKQADVNYQIYVAPNGQVDTFSIKQQMLRDTVYIGSRFPVAWPKGEAEAYRYYGERIGGYLRRMGYTGVAGIDSIITEDGTLLPIIEINGRFTLSTYISFVGHVLGGNPIILSRYFKLLTSSPLHYAELNARLAEEKLLYDPETGCGVLAYTSGTLPIQCDAASGDYHGRLFVLIVAPQEQLTNELNDRLEALIAAEWAPQAVTRSQL